MRIRIHQIFPSDARQVRFHALHRDAILHRTNQPAKIATHALVLVDSWDARMSGRWYDTRSSFGMGVTVILARLAASTSGGVACAPFTWMH